MTASLLVPLTAQVSWTHALRQIVINCYRYHGREDLLPAFEEDDKEKLKTQTGTTVQVTSSGAETTLATTQGVGAPSPPFPGKGGLTAASEISLLKHKRCNLRWTFSWSLWFTKVFSPLTRM